MNEIVKKPDNYAARYEATDPYAHSLMRAALASQGQLLTCKKGVWGIGQDIAPVPPGALTSSSSRDDARVAQVDRRRRCCRGHGPGSR